MALVLASCGVEQKQFDTTVTSSDGTYELAIRLWDRTTLVESIEPAVGDPQAGMVATVTADPGTDRALVVSWMGGACEIKAEVGFWREGDAYRLSVVHEARSALGSGCSLGGITRAIRITLSSPVAPDEVIVEGAG